MNAANRKFQEMNLIASVYGQEGTQHSVQRNQNMGEVALFAAFCPSTLNTKKDACVGYFVHPPGFCEANQLAAVT